MASGASLVLCVLSLATAFAEHGIIGTARPFTLRQVSSETRRTRSANQEPGNGFPEELQYRLTLEGRGDLTLSLHRDRSLRLPSVVTKESDGKMYWKPELQSTAVAFYKDRRGHGTFACKRSESPDIDCDMTAMLNFGEESCYISPEAEVADCGSKNYLPIPKLHEPRVDPNIRGGKTELNANVYDRLVRTKRNIVPQPGFKAVEVAYLPDEKFTDMFYQRHTNITAAEIEMRMFFTLLTNEINSYYSTVTMTSSQMLSIQLYPTIVALPGYGLNWPWSENYNDGTDLWVTEDMDKSVEFTVNDSGYLSAQHDYTFAITGYNLRDFDSGQKLVSYTSLSTICTNSKKKYAVTEFTSWNLPRILAHELGHALGARHDETEECPAGVNIMSLYMFTPNATTKDTFYSFSLCSVKDMINFVYNQQACLDNDSFSYTEFVDSFCKGFLGQEENSVDKQCQVVTNYVNSTACDDVSEEACYARYKVRCRDSRGRCRRKLKYVWNFTPCGTDKVCYQGNCVAKFHICETSSASPWISSTDASASSTTSTTTGTTTTAAPVLCECCGYKEKRRKKCCKKGVKKVKADCYCCGSLRNVEPPPGWTGKRY